MTSCATIVKMDNLAVIRMEAGNTDDVLAVLSAFIEQYEECFDFKCLEKDNVTERLLTIIFKYLKNSQASNLHEVCLKSLRILSRDKILLEKFINEEQIEVLLQHAALKGSNADKIGFLGDVTIIVEALKCLCNLAYNYPKVQSICSTNGTLDGIVRRLRMHADTNISHSVKYFDLKFMFLMTALSEDVRYRVRGELHAMTYLTEALDFIIKGGNSPPNNQKQYPSTLDENDVELSTEILKVLFNVTARVLSVGVDEEFEGVDRLFTVLRELLLSSTPPNMQDQLVRHTIHLLTNMPHSSYEMLMSQEQAEYDGGACNVIINFLDRQLSAPDGCTYESLSPVLIVLTEGARCSKILRKYIRNIVLPPLKDVKTKPEEGEKLRNKLCRLLIGSNPKLNHLVGEFLFVLCKENVNRMIKYTGFGNAAGMFAARNLLSDAIANADQSSSDSEDSDTEEYLEFRDKINPVTGCYESFNPSVLESMSDEQKEYEIMKLINAVDKLERKGIIKPCRIGEDGKPQPIEHILQMQDEIPKQQMKKEVT